MLRWGPFRVAPEIQRCHARVDVDAASPLRQRWWRNDLAVAVPTLDRAPARVGPRPERAVPPPALRARSHAHTPAATPSRAWGR